MSKTFLFLSVLLIGFVLSAVLSMAEQIHKKIITDLKDYKKKTSHFY